MFGSQRSATVKGQIKNLESERDSTSRIAGTSRCLVA